MVGKPKNIREYFFEATGTAILVFSTCCGHVLLWYPESPVYLVHRPFLRRGLMGFWMAVTVLLIVYCHLGKRSGAHYNPAVTLTFFRLGKVHSGDAIFYVLFQFLGAIIAVAAATMLAGDGMRHQNVHFATTHPGKLGSIAALLGETAIAFVTMLAILVFTNTYRFRQLTGVFVAMLFLSYALIESPLSGSSMNPARSFGPALVGNLWSSIWIYFVAPVFGMLAAAEVYLAFRGNRTIKCAKLFHTSDVACHFKNCGYEPTLQDEDSESSTN